MLKRLLPLLLLLATVLAFGCKGCAPEPCEDVTCLQGEVCQEGTCVPQPTGCDPACASDEVCRAGECVSLDPQCTEVDEPCDASLPVNDGFICLDLDGFGPQEGTCATVCEPDGSCPFGSLCFYLAGQQDQACSSDGLPPLRMRRIRRRATDVRRALRQRSGIRGGHAVLRRR